MELIKLSKFKVRLRALISEVHQLKERERSASEQVQILIQKQKQDEQDFNNKLTEMRAELALSNEIRQKLENKVSYLENDNALLENKQKELKESIHSLLQSRESFIEAYEDSTCEMKRAIEARDRKINLLYDKIKAHSSLFSSIEKEASSVKQVVENAQHTLREKEEVVATLKRKVDEVSTFEKLFVDKIRNLEHRLRNQEAELRRKSTIILDLEAELEAAKLSSKECQPKTEEIQRALSAKELIIDNLVLEKKALHLEVVSLAIVIKKIQDAIVRMNEEDRKAFSSMLEDQGDHTRARDEEIERVEDVQNNGENPHQEASGEECIGNTDAASPRPQSQKSSVREERNFVSCVLEPASSQSLLQQTPNISGAETLI